MTEKYQKEIEEILGQVNDDVPKGKDAVQERGRNRYSIPSEHRAERSRPGSSWLPLKVSAGHFFFTGIILIVAALILRAVIPSLWGPLIWTGVGLLIASYVLFFISPRRRPTERRWRGRPIDDEVAVGPNPLVRFWRWVNRD
jgi:hypothetical protein